MYFQLILGLCFASCVFAAASFDREDIIKRIVALKSLDQRFYLPALNESKLVEMPQAELIHLYQLHKNMAPNILRRYCLDENRWWAPIEAVEMFFGDYSLERIWHLEKIFFGEWESSPVSKEDLTLYLPEDHLSNPLLQELLDNLVVSCGKYFFVECDDALRRLAFANYSHQRIAHLRDLQLTRWTEHQVTWEDLTRYVPEETITPELCVYFKEFMLKSFVFRRKQLPLMLELATILEEGRQISPTSYADAIFGHLNFILASYSKLQQLVEVLRLIPDAGLKIERGKELVNQTYVSDSEFVDHELLKSLSEEMEAALGPIPSVTGFSSSATAVAAAHADELLQDDFALIEAVSDDELQPNRPSIQLVAEEALEVEPFSSDDQLEH